VRWGRDGSEYEPAFKNATYWSNSRHWKWATEPNAREKASFLKENILPMQEFGQLKFADEDDFDLFEFKVMNGHTDHQMLPVLKYKDRTIVFTADLIPSTGHIPLAYVMGYDTRPLLTLDEKEKFMNEAADNNYILFLEHDAVNECCTVEQTDRGVRLKEAFPFSVI
jgi:glyoxylase-like metal-dependent hydrolase (beta-lactamase superfamily II)